MASFPVGQETSAVYRLAGPDGSVAVLNDPADTDYVAGLSGEEGITGLDAAEVRDSYYDRPVDDGAVSGQSWLGRRPIVLNGMILPTSPADRNARWQRLMDATNALRADGTLTWTPAGGDPVFLRYRRQQPARMRGGYNKEFMVALVANDPRIYSVRASTAYFERSDPANVDAHRRFTWASGTGTTLATRTFRLPPGSWRATVYVRRSTSAGTLTAAITPNSGTGSTTPLSLTTGWQVLTQERVTTALESADTTLTLTLNSALTAGQWIELGPVVFESDTGAAASDDAGFAGNWAAGSGYTPSFVTATPPPNIIENKGNAPARPRIRVIGPFTTATATITDGSASVSASYSGTDRVVVDTINKTAVRNGGTNVYGTLVPANTVWGGFLPGFNLARIWASAGGSDATRAEFTWRSTWL